MTAPHQALPWPLPMRAPYHMILTAVMAAPVCASHISWLPCAPHHALTYRHTILAKRRRLPPARHRLLVVQAHRWMLLLAAATSAAQDPDTTNRKMDATDGDTPPPRRYTPPPQLAHIAHAQVQLVRMRRMWYADDTMFMVPSLRTLPPQPEHRTDGSTATLH